VIRRYLRIKTRAQAQQYLEEVRRRVPNIHKRTDFTKVQGR
jgi:hypothetical protein